MAKKLPAYGKAFMEMRKAGKVPSNSVVIAFDWDVGKLFPRIVIADDTPPKEMDFRFLAGLEVIIAYGDHHAERIRELAEAVLVNKPRLLQAFSLSRNKTYILKNSDGEIFL